MVGSVDLKRAKTSLLRLRPLLNRRQRFAAGICHHQGAGWILSPKYGLIISTLEHTTKGMDPFRKLLYANKRRQS